MIAVFWKCQHWSMWALKKSLLFGNNILWLSTLFVTPKKCVLLFVGNFRKVLLFFYMRNSEKSGHNFLVVTHIVSVVCDMNSWKILCCYLVVVFSNHISLYSKIHKPSTDVCKVFVWSLPEKQGKSHQNIEKDLI